MAIVIREIIVKTTVEQERSWRQEAEIPPEVILRLKEELLKELERRVYTDSGRKER